MSNNGFVTRDDLLGANRTRFCEYPFPDDFPIEELAGKTIRIRSLNAKEKSAYEEFFVNPATGEDDDERVKLHREKLVIDCVVDGDGHRLFTLDDIRALSKLDGALLEALAKKIIAHNRFELTGQIKKKSEAMNGSGSS